MMKLCLSLVTVQALGLISISYALRKRRQADYWGPWGEWGECSRTCGIGVTFRDRHCYSYRRDGGSSCVGPFRSYRSCNIQNVRGEYYLNGHWTIDYSRALYIANTVIHYERGTEGDLASEVIYGRGPISEPLILEIISQEPNQGIEYEYYLSRYHKQPEGYFWSVGSWSLCSKECGGGYQTRLVFCTIDNEAYPDYLCRDQVRPRSNKTCNSQSCPRTK
ncbi:hypothetical protein chiPu_0016750, partial [Chiloscyllium punctatum]|nr:hypothetical protein [Chiloscyllium punctatum]